MVEEFAPAAAARSIGAFSAPQAQMVLASVLEGNTQARVWLVGERETPTVLLWDKGNNVFYLAGAPVEEPELVALEALVRGEIRDRSLDEDLHYFHARALSPELEPAVLTLFTGHNLKETAKLFLRCETPSVPLEPQLTGVEFTRIDAALLRRDELENLDSVKVEIDWMWPSIERFIEHGFGTAALYGERIVCWCTAEYLSSASCGIGIETDLEFQRRGVASAVTTRFTAQSLDRGITPHWECDRENAASARVALKTGFAPVEEPVFWAGSFAR